MKHLAWKLAAAFGIAALGVWRQERKSVRMSPYLRERVNNAVDEVEALSEWDTATGSVPDRRSA